MALTPTPAWLGIPDFGLVHITPDVVAQCFQTYLNTGSKLSGVSLEDIDRSVISLPANPSTVTLAELLKLGMKLFDAVVWLTANRPSTHPLTIDPSKTKNSIISMHEVARSVFYCYFMLLVQARYPARTGATDAPKIPNFLRTILGMDLEQGIYVDRICSFEPSKFNPAWARHVQFSQFGQESLSRFGLGVAGYRMFGPFKLYKPKQDMDPTLLPAFNFARSIALSRASWEIHPLTRAPDVLTRRGNLNKNLGNLILEAFTDADLAEMVAAKVIYALPTREPTHLEYKQWSEANDITGTAYIFATSNQ